MKRLYSGKFPDSNFENTKISLKKTSNAPDSPNLLIIIYPNKNIAMIIEFLFDLTYL